MKAAKSQLVLDTFASVAMITVCITLLWGQVVRRAPPAGDAAEGAGAVRVFREPPAYSVGDVFGTVEGFDAAAAPMTLAVFLRSGCRYCTESMPFYRRLAATERRARIVVFGAQTVPTLTAYLDEGGFKPDQVLQVKAGVLKFYATPTLALVGSDGKIKGVWLKPSLLYR